MTVSPVGNGVGLTRPTGWVPSGEADAFGSLRVLPLYQWDRVILAPRDHELADLDQRPDLEALAEYPLVTYLFRDRPESSLMSSFTARGLTPRIAITARDADIIKTYVRMGLGVGVLDSLFPRLTTWIGFDDDLPLKPSHRAFTQLLAPHLSDRQIDGGADSSDFDQDAADLPLHGGPVAPLEMPGC